jgi:hypothetical protein
MRHEASRRPPERAQLVWRRAVALTGQGGPAHPHAIALDLLAAAHHDPDTMAHALTIGRTHVEAHPGDAMAQSAAGLLRAAVQLLGARRHTDDGDSTGAPQC